jgi:hypothetical protein
MLPLPDNPSIALLFPITEGALGRLTPKVPTVIVLLLTPERNPGISETPGSPTGVVFLLVIVLLTPEENPGISETPGSPTGVDFLLTIVLLTPEGSPGI